MEKLSLPDVNEGFDLVWSEWKSRACLGTDGYRKVPYHYYEAGSRDECAEYLLHESAPYGGHRFITEKSVFAKWAKTHAITFLHPAWLGS
ncbi:hypothetical protein JZ751_009166 [Albula glossodonta]|uniref:Uncharacterized protein n=1 Tax=Albula glossodonta TaxID=121402 RepID=A0A8T2N1V4_9TELE|nr:hypothetical protein JZ751_009166 [Albula glossodonta]